PGVPCAPGEDLVQRQPGDVLGARQVRGEAAHAQDRHEPAAPQDQHGRGPRRLFRPLRPPARGRLRLRVHPGPGGDHLVSTLRVLKSYLAGRWTDGTGRAQALVNPATEEPLAEVRSGGDLAGALEHARKIGSPALRAMTFAARGAMLRRMTDALQARRNELLDLAVANGGNTRSDAKFDVDGAIFTLAAYADLGKGLGEVKVLADAEGIPLARNPRFHGQHVLVPRTGVAVHVNAFNFPAWGLAEKAAVALLAGMPVLSKPATSSALVAHRILEILVEAQALPEGAFSLLLGGAGDLLDHVGPFDVVAFTGSSETGTAIRSLPQVIKNSVRVNVE